MGRTIMGAVVSLDGYIAHDDNSVGPLFDWYGNGDVEWKFSESQEQPARTSQASRDFMRAVYPRIGAEVIGRRLFDLTTGGEVSQLRVITSSSSRTRRRQTGSTRALRRSRS